MTKVLYTLRVIVAHPPLSLASDQYEEILQELPYQLTARTEREMHDHLLDDALKEGWTIQEVHIENKQETR